MEPKVELPNLKSHTICDNLAAERTLLADERTLLAYVRTAITSGIGGASLLQFFHDGILLFLIGWGLITMGVFFFFWGFFRYLKVRLLVRRL